MFSGNMNSEIINTETNNFEYQARTTICYFCHNEIEDKDFIKSFSCPICKVIMHNTCYIHYVDLWNWKFGGCLLCAQRNNRAGPCCLCLSDNGILIPVTMNNLSNFNQTYDHNNKCQMPIRNFYAHLGCYNGYAASFRCLSPKFLNLDYRFVKYLNETQYTRCSICGKMMPLNPIDKYFIKCIKPLEINQNSSEIEIECVECVIKYFNEWLTQASSNEMRFSIPLGMIIDEEIAERREEYFNLSHEFCDIYIRQNAEAGNNRN